MPHYLVFEKVAEPQFSSGSSTSRMNDFTNAIGLVEADSPNEAVNAVIGATRRVGQYAVVQAEYVSFLPSQVETSDDGILRVTKKGPAALNGGDIDAAASQSE